MKQKQLRQHQEIRRGSSLLLKMFALVALMLCSVGSVWAQTRDLVIPTNTEENGNWNGSDQYTYNVPFDGIGSVKAAFSDITSGSDRVDGKVKFKAGTELNITAPAGYVIKYVKLDFDKNYDYHFNFAYDLYPYGNASSVEWTPNPEGTHTNDNAVRVANRKNAGQPTDDMLVTKITVRLHKAPSISIDAVTEYTISKNQTLTLHSAPSGEPTVFGGWFLIEESSATSGNPEAKNEWWIQNSTDFTFDPSAGFPLPNRTDWPKSYDLKGANTYYFGAVATQNCIGGNGYEASAPKVYKVVVTEKAQYEVTANWRMNIPDHAKGWGLPTFTVKADGTTVDASNYTLNYEVVDGPITVSDGCVNVNEDHKGDVVGHIKVTAVPNDPAAYAEGSVTIDVNIQHTARVKVTVTPQEARIGEKISVGVQRENGFTDPRYVWTFSDGASDYLYGATGTIDNNAGEDDRNLTFVAKKATTNPVNLHLKFTSTAGYVKENPDSEQADAQIKVKPVAVPTVYEDIDGVHFTYEQDYDCAYGGRVDAFLEYFNGEPKADNSNRVQVGFGDMESIYTATNIPQGSTIYVKSVIHYKDADGGDHYEASETIKFVTDDAAEFPTLDLMKQPRWANGIAKRYIPIGVINELNEGVLTPLTSQWPEGVTHGKGAITNNTMGYFLGGNEYPIEREGRGVCISRNGKAHWAWTGPESDPNRQWLPKSAAFVMDVAGTVDIVVFAENTFHNSENTTDGDEGNRRVITAWYLNDQCKDGKPIKLDSWGVVGKRCEGNFSNGGNGNELGLHIRLPQLGTDGKTTLLFTYEGDNWGNDANDTDHDLWISGFMIKRPDLRISIGRTDDRYTDGNDLTNQCVKEKNTPYIWSFEPQATRHKDGANIHKDGKDAVGFRPASDTNSKKTNVFDGRTYICGEKCDHLLVYCDNYDETGNVKPEERPEFDGRVGDGRDGNAHLELVRPTVMAGNNGNDDKFNPIKSNGIKVNVTGSGWFKIKASAPNCPVRMKVLTSRNGGVSTIRVLKEFILPKTSEMGWNEYTAYLKAQVTDNQTFDDDDAEGDIEKEYMALYVVFEPADGVALDADGKISGTSEYPQLNINQLSWLNEEPADYVFQREENPKLLTEWRKIKRDGETVLYWKTGNDNDASYPVLKENGIATYDRNDQYTTSIKDGKGVKSPYGKTSVSVPSSAGTYDAYWDISAKPSTNSHTELAYANKNTVIGKDSPEYVNKADRGNTEFDIPISGSFIRICAMKNTYVIAHVLPCKVDDSDPNANADGKNGTTEGEVYVLDETGAPIPYKPNGEGLDDDAKRLGYISSMLNSSTGSANGYKSNGGTMRIDFTANAGKEYFICAKNASISLARLEVQDWRYKPTKSTTTLELTDNADNSTTITGAYDTKEFYRDAKLTRTFAANKWASLVLPFSLNEKKFEEVFGEGAQCLHFTEVDEDAKKVYLTHHYYNMIVAGRPVFVRPAKDVTITNPVFNDVTLQAKEVRNTTTAKGFEFVASYDKTPISKYDLYMNNDNAIKYQPKDGVNYPGMRSFIKSPDGFDPTEENTGSSTGGAKAMFLNFDDADASTATGIEELISEEFGDNVIVVTKSTKVYDLKGRMVADGADIDNLPAGIYVVNGKKFVVK